MQQYKDICSALEAKLEMAERALFHCDCNLQLTIQMWIGAVENVEPLMAKRADNSAEIACLIQQLREQAESPEENQLLDAASPRWNFNENYGDLLRKVVDGQASAEAGAETTNLMLTLLLDHASWKAFVEFLRARVKHAEHGEDSKQRMMGRIRELVRQNQVLKSVVAERKRLQEKLSQSASIIECANDAIVVYTLGGTIVSWNTGAESVYGYSAGEMFGRSRSILMPSNEPDEIPKVLEKLQRHERIPVYEAIHIRKGGHRILVSTSVSPVKNMSGDLVGFAVITRQVDNLISNSRSTRSTRRKPMTLKRITRD